jgi:hypothetical protein
MTKVEAEQNFLQEVQLELLAGGALPGQKPVPRFFAEITLAAMEIINRHVVKK